LRYRKIIPATILVSGGASRLPLRALEKVEIVGTFWRVTNQIIDPLGILADENAPTILGDLTR
jgi:hypothetical protein